MAKKTSKVEIVLSRDVSIDGELKKGGSTVSVSSDVAQSILLRQWGLTAEQKKSADAELNKRKAAKAAQTEKPKGGE